MLFPLIEALWSLLLVVAQKINFTKSSSSTPPAVSSSSRKSSGRFKWKKKKKSTTCLVCFDTISKANRMTLSCGCDATCSGCVLSSMNVATNHRMGQEIKVNCSNCMKLLQERDWSRFSTTHPRLYAKYQELNTLASLPRHNFYGCPRPGCYSGGFTNFWGSAKCRVCSFPIRKADLSSFVRWLVHSLRCLILIDEEEQNNIWKKLFTKKCPSCNSPIQKNMGCSHMSCIRCNHQFCWLCLKPWYGHSSDVCQFIAFRYQVQKFLIPILLAWYSCCGWITSFPLSWVLGGIFHILRFSCHFGQPLISLGLAVMGRKAMIPLPIIGILLTQGGWWFEICLLFNLIQSSFVNPRLAIPFFLYGLHCLFPLLSFYLFIGGGVWKMGVYVVNLLYYWTAWSNMICLMILMGMQGFRWFWRPKTQQNHPLDQSFFTLLEGMVWWNVVANHRFLLDVIFFGVGMAWRQGGWWLVVLSLLGFGCLKKVALEVVT